MGNSSVSKNQTRSLACQEPLGRVSKMGLWGSEWRRGQASGKASLSLLGTACVSCITKDAWGSQQLADVCLEVRDIDSRAVGKAGSVQRSPFYSLRKPRADLKIVARAGTFCTHTEGQWEATETTHRRCHQCAMCPVRDEAPTSKNSVCF